MDDSSVEPDCEELKRGGFGVSVVGRGVVYSNDPKEFPDYGGLVKYGDVTSGKKGGEGNGEVLGGYVPGSPLGPLGGSK